MSIAAVAWALRQHVGDATAKLILIALADFADEQGKCWPSQQVLSDRAECSIDTVQRKLKFLENFITIESRTAEHGGRTSNCYQLLVSEISVTKTTISSPPSRNVRGGTKAQPHTATCGGVEAADCGTPYRSNMRYPLPQQGAVTGTVNEPSIEPPPPGVPQADADALWQKAIADGERIKGGKQPQSARAVFKSEGNLNGSDGILLRGDRLTIFNGRAEALLADFPNLDLQAVCDRACPEVRRLSYPTADDAAAVIRKWARIESDRRPQSQQQKFENSTIRMMRIVREAGMLGEENASAT